MKYTCPCCGYKTLEEESPGSYEICSICKWENDNLQFDNPHRKGGANGVSLYEAQRNYLLFGACEERYIKFVRKTNENDVKDFDWKPL